MWENGLGKRSSDERKEGRRDLKENEILLEISTERNNLCVLEGGVKYLAENS